MKYKVEKGTPLFEKLENLEKQIRKVEKQAFNLVKEMGFTRFHPRGNFTLAGGINAIHAAKKPEGYAFAYGPSERNAFFQGKQKPIKNYWQK